MAILAVKAISCRRSALVASRQRRRKCLRPRLVSARLPPVAETRPEPSSVVGRIVFDRVGGEPERPLAALVGHEHGAEVVHYVDVCEGWREGSPPSKRVIWCSALITMAAGRRTFWGVRDGNNRIRPVVLLNGPKVAPLFPLRVWHPLFLQVFAVIGAHMAGEGQRTSEAMSCAKCAFRTGS